MAVKCYQNPKDLRHPLFWRDVFVEMFLSMILSFFLGANQVQYGGYQATPVHAGFVMGTCMFCIIEGFGHISGAHVNPCITFMFTLRRDISVVRGIFYVLAQCTGGAIGAMLIYGVNAVDHRDQFVIFQPAPGISDFQAVIFEAVVTLLMCLTTLGVVNNDQRNITVNMPGLPIGFSISIGIMIGRSYTGASLNPMIPLGPCIHTGNFKYYWIYWVGPYLGAALSVLIDYLMSMTYRKYSKHEVHEPGTQSISLDDANNSKAGSLEDVSSTKSDVHDFKHTGNGALRHRINGRLPKVLAMDGDMSYKKDMDLYWDCPPPFEQVEILNAVNDAEWEMIGTEEKGRPPASGRVVFVADPRKYGQRKSQGAKYKQAITTALEFTYPLKLHIPGHASESPCAWVYPITFGGGLVEGDNINMEVEAGKNTSVLVTTQSSSKVFHCLSGLTTQQTYKYRIHDNALLAVLPDPVVCFKDAAYKQSSEVHMAPKANLVLVDWLTAGRVARGESWQFKNYSTCNRIITDDKAWYRDAICLADDNTVTMATGNGEYKVIGTCILVGPDIQDHCDRVMETIGKKKSFGDAHGNDTLLSVSPISGCNEELKGCVVKFSTKNTVQAYEVVQRLLQPLYEVLGGDPFYNKS